MQTTPWDKLTGEETRMHVKVWVLSSFCVRLRDVNSPCTSSLTECRPWRALAKALKANRYVEPSAGNQHKHTSEKKTKTSFRRDGHNIPNGHARLRMIHAHFDGALNEVYLNRDSKAYPLRCIRCNSRLHPLCPSSPQPASSTNIEHAAIESFKANTSDLLHGRQLASSCRHSFSLCRLLLLNVFSPFCPWCKKSAPTGTRFQRILS